MEKLSESERILLGYTHRDPYGTLPNPSHRNSDVDFHDVFGGPPRRSSINELRRSRADSMDSCSWRGSGSGSGEKPVFGEMSSPARRRHLKDDFFSDIFQSTDSSCSSPTKPDRDFFPSLSPGSRISSPTRTPLRCEPVVGGASLPAQLSLSMKLVKGIDHPAVSSPTHCALYKNVDGAPGAFSYPSSPNTFVPGFTTRAIPAQDDLNIDGHASYRQSPLSRQISRNLDKSLEASDSANLSIESQSRKDPTSLETYVSSGLFHFSIYKWAGKGVTLIMPSNSNLQNKYESRFRRLPEVVLQEVDLTLCKDNMSTVTKASKSQSEGQDNKSLKNLIIESKDDADSTIVKDLLPAEFESKFLHTDVTKSSDTCNNNREEVPVTVHEAQKHELKNLHRLFDDDLGKKGNEDIIRQVKETEGLSRGQQSVYDDINTKKQAGGENRSNPVEEISPSKRDAPVSPEEKMHGSRVKGNVKDFIKIFNQEVSPKRKGTFETLDRRSRGKGRGKGKIEDQVSASAAKADEQVKTTSRNNNSALSDTPISINQNLEKAEKAKSNIIFDVHMIEDSLSERSDPLGPCSDSAPDIVDTSVFNLEESPCEDFEECLVEQLSQGHKHLQTDSHEDQIKIIDARIREWSKGKEGNIRSLLSTLQYVLWPESGWKPVPLVDIIEGTSVKRAYQRALLCLHPDKLLQKGAATHQKYIAEKVFEILQEAWIHFNSVSQF